MTHNAPPILSARDVTKSYRTGEVEVTALDGIDLAVSAGELAMVVGPSGSGKTTLLNCLSGVDSIDDGAHFVVPVVGLIALIAVPLVATTVAAAWPAARAPRLHPAAALRIAD